MEASQSNLVSALAKQVREVPTRIPKRTKSAHAAMDKPVELLKNLRFHSSTVSSKRSGNPRVQVRTVAMATRRILTLTAIRVGQKSLTTTREATCTILDTSSR